MNLKSFIILQVVNEIWVKVKRSVQLWRKVKVRATDVWPLRSSKVKSITHTCTPLGKTKSRRYVITDHVGQFVNNASPYFLFIILTRSMLIQRFYYISIENEMRSRSSSKHTLWSVSNVGSIWFIPNKPRYRGLYFGISLMSAILLLLANALGGNTTFLMLKLTNG